MTTIDITPTWRDLVPVLVAAAVHGDSAKGRREAMDELLRMADIADGVGQSQSPEAQSTSDIDAYLDWLEAEGRHREEVAERFANCKLTNLAKSNLDLHDVPFTHTFEKDNKGELVHVLRTKDNDTARLMAEAAQGAADDGVMLTERDFEDILHETGLGDRDTARRLYEAANNKALLAWEDEQRRENEALIERGFSPYELHDGSYDYWERVEAQDDLPFTHTFEKDSRGELVHVLRTKDNHTARLWQAAPDLLHAAILAEKLCKLVNTWADAEQADAYEIMDEIVAVAIDETQPTDAIVKATGLTTEAALHSDLPQARREGLEPRPTPKATGLQR